MGQQPKAQAGGATSPLHTSCNSLQCVACPVLPLLAALRPSLVWAAPLSQMLLLPCGQRLGPAGLPSSPNRPSCLPAEWKSSLWPTASLVFPAVQLKFQLSRAAHAGGGLGLAPPIVPCNSPFVFHALSVQITRLARGGVCVCVCAQACTGLLLLRENVSPRKAGFCRGWKSREWGRTAASWSGMPTADAPLCRAPAWVAGSLFLRFSGR